jgi:hypothetical protein
MIKVGTPASEMDPLAQCPGLPSIERMSTVVHACRRRRRGGGRAPDADDAYADSLIRAMVEAARGPATVPGA